MHGDYFVDLRGWSGVPSYYVLQEAKLAWIAEHAGREV